MTSKLSHIDDSGDLHMVNVSSKPESDRLAVAKGEIQMQENTVNLILHGDIEKGEVLATSRIAGIMAAKRTADLIPLCHPLALNQIQVDVNALDDKKGFEIIATIRSKGKTGVEMEALTAVSIAALTIYDMTKAVDKDMHINNIRLVKKIGGRSGDVIRE